MSYEPDVMTPGTSDGGDENLHPRDEWLLIHTAPALMQAAHEMVSADSPSHDAVFRTIRRVAEVYSATCAWLLTVEEGDVPPRVAWAYNLDALVQVDVSGLASLSGLAQVGNARGPYVRSLAELSQGGLAGMPDTRFLLCLPLGDAKTPAGVLTFGFRDEPSWHSGAHRALGLLTSGIGLLLELIGLQETKDSFRARAAVLAFVARTLSEESGSERVLGFGLEYSVTFLNLSGAEVWLRGEGSRVLEMASSMTLGASPPPSDRTRMVKEIVERVAESGAPLQAPRLADLGTSVGVSNAQVVDVDSSLVAVPLSHRGEIVGVLAAYDKPGRLFGDLDVGFLRSVAGLCASCIVNERQSRYLQTAAMQQEALLALGQDVGSGLELSTTLGRCLWWARRLVEVEFALIWLTTRSDDTLELAACLGGDPFDRRPVRIARDNGAIWNAVTTGKPAICEGPSTQTGTWQDVIGARARQLLTVPLRYRGTTIGALSLVNKIEGPFLEKDLDVLSLASEMIALAVGNAKVHAQVLELAQQREKLYRAALQSTRLATIGRLTASLAHEIKNPMQAIEAAMVLCAEQKEDPAGVAELVGLSLKESERVVRLVDRLQRIYAPMAGSPGPVSLNQTLVDAVETARKELTRQGITIRFDPEPRSPEINGESEQLRLVFLSLILSLGDVIGEAGSRELRIVSETSNGRAVVRFRCSQSVPKLRELLQADSQDVVTGTGFSLWFVQEVLRTLNGEAMSSEEDGGSEIVVSLPLTSPLEDEAELSTGDAI